MSQPESWKIIRYIIGRTASNLWEDSGLDEPELHLEDAWLDDLDCPGFRAGE